MSICDHKSVGMLIRKGGKILLIERKRPIFGFAPPAGHVDNKGSFLISVDKVGKTEQWSLLVSLGKHTGYKMTDGIQNFKTETSHISDTKIIKHFLTDRTASQRYIASSDAIFEKNGYTFYFLFFGTSKELSDQILFTFQFTK